MPLPRCSIRRHVSSCRDIVLTSSLSLDVSSPSADTDSKFIDPIEETLRECIQRWSVIQKRQIWESTESGSQSDVRADVYAMDTIDMDLEGELMFHLIEYLSLDSGGGPAGLDEDDHSA